MYNMTEVYDKMCSYKTPSSDGRHTFWRLVDVDCSSWLCAFVAINAKDQILSFDVSVLSSTRLLQGVSIERRAFKANLVLE
jgi:hypothetical protein